MKNTKAKALRAILDNIDNRSVALQGREYLQTDQTALAEIAINWYHKEPKNLYQAIKKENKIEQIALEIANRN